MGNCSFKHDDADGLLAQPSDQAQGKSFKAFLNVCRALQQE